MNIKTLKGFTFIEIIVTILISSILGLLISHLVRFSLSTVKLADENFRNTLKLQAIIENITYDYIHRCFRDVKKQDENNGQFTIQTLQEKIGLVGKKITGKGDINYDYQGGFSYKHPYGQHPLYGYIPYYIQNNTFVNEKQISNISEDKNIKLYNFIKDITYQNRILLVTLRLLDENQNILNQSLSVLFTEKDDFK